VPPVDSRQDHRSRFSPKGGFIYTPLTNTTLRGAYTRSLGGVFFDNSLRLEPTQIAGFNQSLRSIIPESVIGNVAGTRFETFGLGLDQKFASQTYVSAVGEFLESDAERTLGAFTRRAGTLVAAPTGTRQELNYRERSLTISLNQLVGDTFAFGARYRLTDADINARFTAVPATLAGAKQDTEATLHQVQLYALYNCACGFFSQIDTIWSQQSNRDYAPDIAGDDFWQLNAFVGYRFLRRHAEARVGVLNITDQNYRLNPLTLYSELPRERTFYASFKFYF
jgi:hypothetical protein